MARAALSERAAIAAVGRVSTGGEATPGRVDLLCHIYIYIYVYMCVYIYIYKCIHMYIYIVELKLRFVGFEARAYCNVMRSLYDTI